MSRQILLKYDRIIENYILGNKKDAIIRFKSLGIENFADFIDYALERETPEWVCNFLKTYFYLKGSKK
jgi:hypothetical protein